jgi:hypothetical protein
MLTFNNPGERLAFEQRARAASIDPDLAMLVQMAPVSLVTIVQLSEKAYGQIARGLDKNELISKILMPTLRRCAEDMEAPPFPREDLHVPEMGPHPMTSASMLQSAAPLDSPRSHGPRSNPRGPQPGIIGAINLATTRGKCMHLTFSSAEDRLLFENRVKNNVEQVKKGDVHIVRMGPQSARTVLQVDNASVLQDGGQNVQEEYWNLLRVMLKNAMSEPA